MTHFLSNAQGSASEVETEILIAHRLGFLRAESYNKLRGTLDEIGRMLTGLTQYLSVKTN